MRRRVSVADGGGVEGGGVMTLPRWTKDRVLDQRAPALAVVGGGTVVGVWEDWGGGVSAAEGRPDVAVEIMHGRKQ